MDFSIELTPFTFVSKEGELLVITNDESLYLHEVPKLKGNPESLLTNFTYLPVNMVKFSVLLFNAGPSIVLLNK